MILQLLLAGAAAAFPGGDVEPPPAPAAPGAALASEVLVITPEMLGERIIIQGNAADPRVMLVAPDGSEQLIFAPGDSALFLSEDGAIWAPEAWESGDWRYEVERERRQERSRRDEERARRAEERALEEQERLMREQELLAREAMEKAMMDSREVQAYQRALAQALATHQVEAQAAYAAAQVEAHLAAAVARLEAVEGQLHGMSHAWAASDSDEEREQLREAIEGAANDMFDLRMQLYEGQIEVMRQRLLELETNLEHQQQSRDEMIEQWLDERLGDEEAE